MTYIAGNCGTSKSFTYTNGTNNSSKDPSFLFTNPGTYILKLFATNSCGSYPKTDTITVKAPPTASINKIKDLCDLGKISPTATIKSCKGDNTGLTYLWSFPGGTPSTDSNSTPPNISYDTYGKHGVSLTVTNECGNSVTAVDTFVINKPPVVTNTELEQTICSGAKTTLVTLTSDNPLATFTWTASATPGVTGFSTSGSSNTLPVRTLFTSGSTPGKLTYVITPSINGCPGPTKEYVVNVNPAPKITKQPVSSNLCEGGIPNPMEVIVENAVETPTYQWYKNNTNSIIGAIAITDSTKSTFTPPADVIDTIYYFCNINLGSTPGCSSITSEIATVIINSTPSITTQPTATQNICVGGTIPSPLKVVYTGGAGAASYQWYSNMTNSTVGGTPVIGGTGAKTLSYTPPAFATAGKYYYYLEMSMAGNGCGSISSLPAEIVVVEDPKVTDQPLPTQTVCKGAKAETLRVKATGGLGTFAYQWYWNSSNNTTSGTILSGEVRDSLIVQTSTTGKKYYYCEISQPDGPGCNAVSDTARVIVNPTPSFKTQPASETVCQSTTANSLTIATQNGIGTPSLQWYSNSVSQISGSTKLLGETHETFTPPTDSARTEYYYCVASFDSGGCSEIVSDFATFTVNPKPVIEIKDTTICSGSTFMILPVNTSKDIVPAGTTYIWSAPEIIPAGTITGGVAETTQQTSISQELINTTNFPATATYTVTPTIGSCAGSSFKVTVTVNPAMNPNIVTNNISCNGANDGSITTNITGGVPFTTGDPFKITWTYPDGSLKSGASIKDLIPGTYDLLIQDMGGCPIQKSIKIEEPEGLSIITDSIKNITCNGSANGKIKITVTGGTKPYNYIWKKDNAPFPAINDSLYGLAPGVYDVTVSDKFNCAQKTVTYTISEPPILSLKLTPTHILCHGDSLGAMNAIISGGTTFKNANGVADYLYEWSGPNGYKNSTQNIDSVPAGTYTLTVTDSLGCSISDSKEIIEPTAIKVVVTKSDVTCYGNNNAFINLDITGGLPYKAAGKEPYTVLWDNLATGPVQNNLSAGDYTITIIDSIGCQHIEKVNIPNAPLFSVNPVVKNVSCNGANDGSINLNFTGGKAPVNLVWSDGSTSGTTRNGLGKGTYTVKITDGAPCEINESFYIDEPEPLVVKEKITHATDCNNPNSGAIRLIVTGGKKPYTFQWSNGASADSLIDIQAGSYSVTISDVNGCSTEPFVYEVKRPKPISIKIATTTDFDCATKSIKAINKATVSGGVLPYHLKWSTGSVSGANNEIMETTLGGMVSVQVTDSSGCTADYSFNIDLPASGIEKELTECNSHTYQFRSLQPTVAGEKTEYLWDFGDGETSTLKNPTHSYKTTETFDVKLTVTTPSCTSPYNEPVVVEPVPELSLDREPKLCIGDSIVLHALGADSYQWFDGSRKDSILIKQKGDFSFIGTSKAGCSAIYNFSVVYNDTYNYTVQSDREFVTPTNPEISVNSENTPSTLYFWDFGDGVTADGNNQSHKYNITKDGFYDIKLKVINPTGCVEYASKRIWIKVPELPNTFTPDNDQVNDVFMKNWHIKVYNRNGIVMYDGYDGWDGTYNGKPVTSDTYFYVLYYLTESGIKTKEGFVTLIR